MCYQNGKKILPPPLLSAIQEYIDCEYIYIPRKTNNKRPWGSTKGTKQQTAERNQEIFCRSSKWNFLFTVLCRRILFVI